MHSHFPEFYPDFTFKPQCNSLCLKLASYCSNNRLNTGDVINIRECFNVLEEEIWIIHMAREFRQYELINSTNFLQVALTNKGVRWYCKIIQQAQGNKIMPKLDSSLVQHVDQSTHHTAIDKSTNITNFNNGGFNINNNRIKSKSKTEVGIIEKLINFIKSFFIN